VTAVEQEVDPRQPAPQLLVAAADDDQLPVTSLPGKGTNLGQQLPRALPSSRYEDGEAALVDGDSWLGAFRRQILPLAAPVLAVIGLISFISTLNEFVIASVILETQQKFTLPVGLWQFIDQKYSEHWGPFAAGVLIAAVPAALLFAFLQRYIVQGLTQGAVKG